jgi:eight-cysteine-cluster-containing protein
VVTTYRQLYQGRAEVVVKAESEYLRVGLDELTSNARAYDGRKVEVRGEPTAPAVCTKMACGPSNPCCNRCGARFWLDAPSGDRVELADPNDAQNFACSGNECTIESSCRGFPRVRGNGPYLVRSTFRLGEHDARRIDVDSVRADDCQRGGCSGQLCSNGGPLVSTCEWREWYACLRNATGEVQASGHCGISQTTELRQCLARYGQ